MRTTLLLTILLILLPACTAVDYEAPQLGDRALVHRSIAVLPFEMVFTGKAPSGLTGDQIARIEEAESLAFQAAMYDSLLDRASVGRQRRIQIDIQPVEATNRILDDSDIDLRESWQMPADELARTLGVDAVVRTSVQKTRYLSDLASFGIELGLGVLYEVTNGEAAWWLPPVAAKTHDIYAASALEDGEDGSLLWKVAVHRGTDWTRPADDVIVGITRKLARKFPYQS